MQAASVITASNTKSGRTGIAKSLVWRVVPESLLLSSVPAPASGIHPRVYIVMNNKLEQDFEIVEGKALTIVSRSFTTAVKANTQNTLIATYDFARRNKWDFNLASIDAEYPTTTSMGFDRNYMQQLYQYGYAQGLSGSPWRKTLPTTYTVPTASVQRMPMVRVVPARAVAR